ncbi:pseudouridine synthase [Paenarthrobacter sp. Z7-10]|nr:pseudouridine synthase [Paenarthrobacter sp. Z7-10]
MTPSRRPENSGRSQFGQDRNQPRGGAPRGAAPRSGAPRNAGAPRDGAPRGRAGFTDAPRDGAAGNDRRSGGAPRGNAAPRSGSAPREGAQQDAAAKAWRARSGSPETGSARSGSAQAGSARSGSPRSGSAQSGAPKFAAGHNKSATPAGGTRAGAPKGPRAFNGERFGRSLGPVKNRPTEQNRRPVNQGRGEDLHDPAGVRLQKVMASAGVASRRVCEDMIAEGRVEVDGHVVQELGLRVDPKQVTISVDGMRLQLDESLLYMVFNKPKGVVSTMDDPEGRRCVGDYLKNRQGNERLFHVGRLDTATEGLLLLTNDGELANRLTHPKYEVPKTYLAQVRGPMAAGVGAQMREGIELEDGMARVDSFKLVDSTPGHILAEVVLHSGKNRIVRRMFEAVGYPVERLVRTQIGPIRMNDQRQGSIRVLGRQEVGHLLASVGM